MQEMNKIEMKPPGKGGLLLFFAISLIHVLLLLLISLHPLFLLFIIVELPLLILSKRRRMNILLRVFIISLIITIMNTLLTDGKILIAIGMVTVTSEGLILGLQRGGILFLLFLFTNNTLGGKEELIGNSISSNFPNSKFLLPSMMIFLKLWKSFSHEMTFKKWLLRSVRILSRRHEKYHYIVPEDGAVIDKRFILYNFALVFVAIIITAFLLFTGRDFL
jgi:hypothetical protein